MGISMTRARLTVLRPVRDFAPLPLPLHIRRAPHIVHIAGSALLVAFAAAAMFGGC